MSNKHVVAVYGSLRRGMGNHGLLAQSEYLLTETVHIPYFMVSLGGFPGLVPSKDGNHPIIVELYSVDDTTLRRLDGLEGFRGEDNPSNFYNRITILTSAGPALIYVLQDRGQWEDERIVKDGDWVHHRRESKGY